MNGWDSRVARSYGHPLPRQVATVIWYALKPWPLHCGRRSLETDVLATGVLLAPWLTARAAAYAAPVVAINPLASHRTCEVCGKSLAGKRSDARYCGVTHRKTACERRKREAAA